MMMNCKRFYIPCIYIGFYSINFIYYIILHGYVSLYFIGFFFISKKLSSEVRNVKMFTNKYTKFKIEQ